MSVVITGEVTSTGGTHRFRKRGSLGDGSATPMRGKSTTCRKEPLISPGSSTCLKRSLTAGMIGALRKVEDLRRIGVAKPLILVTPSGSRTQFRVVD